MSFALRIVMFIFLFLAGREGYRCFECYPFGFSLGGGVSIHFVETK